MQPVVDIGKIRRLAAMAVKRCDHHLFRRRHFAIDNRHLLAVDDKAGIVMLAEIGPLRLEGGPVLRHVAAILFGVKKRTPAA